VWCLILDIFDIDFACFGDFGGKKWGGAKWGLLKSEGPPSLHMLRTTCLHMHCYDCCTVVVFEVQSESRRSITDQ